MGRAASTNQKYLIPALGSDTSSVWNFYARFSDVILRENQWWRREMSAVLSGYLNVSTNSLLILRNKSSSNKGIDRCTITKAIATTRKMELSLNLKGLCHSCLVLFYNNANYRKSSFKPTPLSNKPPPSNKPFFSGEES